MKTCRKKQLNFGGPRKFKSSFVPLVISTSSGMFAFQISFRVTVEKLGARARVSQNEQFAN